MRWTPAGAAAPDPKMRPPTDGLFTGLGAGEQGSDLKPFPGNKCWPEPFRKVTPNPVRLFRFAGGLLVTPFQIIFLAQAPQGLSRPSSGGRIPRVQGRSPGRRPPHRNGGPFSFPFRARKGKSIRQDAVCRQAAACPFTGQPNSAPQKSYPHLLAVTGGGFGVSFWCEEESCSRVTVAAPFPVLIQYPILAKNLLSSCELSVNFAGNMRFCKNARYNE